MLPCRNASLGVPYEAKTRCICNMKLKQIMKDFSDELKNLLLNIFREGFVWVDCSERKH